MVEQEYVRIESTIKKVQYGTERTDRLIGMSNDVSDVFKDELWNNYLIDIDNISMTENCEMLEKLKRPITNADIAANR